MHPTGVVVIAIVALVCLIECVCHRFRRQVVTLADTATARFALTAVVGGTIEVVSSDPVRRR